MFCANTSSLFPFFFTDNVERLSASFTGRRIRKKQSRLWTIVMGCLPVGLGWMETGKVSRVMIKIKKKSVLSYYPSLWFNRLQIKWSFNHRVLWYSIHCRGLMNIKLWNVVDSRGEKSMKRATLINCEPNWIQGRTWQLSSLWVMRKLRKTQTIHLS